MRYKKKSHKVSIVMGSQSDYKTMKNCEKVLKILKVNYETNIVSAHRERLIDFMLMQRKQKIITFLLLLLGPEDQHIYLV